MSKDAEDRVRGRAFSIWEVEGRPEGRDVENWLQAERELADTPIDGPMPDDRGPDERVHPLAEPGRESLETLTDPAPEPADSRV